MNEAIELTRRWVKEIVVGLNFCPFASPVLSSDRVRYVASSATTEEEAFKEFLTRLDELHLAEPDEVSTALIIYPNALRDFLDFNDFIGYAEETLEELDLDGDFLIASFHPDYYFADTEPGDLSNFTNRSPYPVLQLLRQNEMSMAIEKYGDTSEIPMKNIALLNTMGEKKVHELWAPFLGKMDET